MRAEEWIQDELDALADKSLYRKLTTYSSAGGRININGETYLNLSSNDYLGLSTNPEVLASAESELRNRGSAAGASRLVTGSLECHDELEKLIAEYKGYPAALVLGSGYLVNTGVIPALADKKDVVLADKLIHASIIDGIAQSGALLERFNHNDVNDLKRRLSKIRSARHIIIITESVFSMDGDIGPLKEICEAANDFNALVFVDEAHSTGVFGTNGSGIVAELGLQSQVNISMGTMSKSFGSYGGFIACSTEMREYIINTARTFIFSTALPPAVIGASIGAIKYLMKNPGLGSGLLAKAERFREKIKDADFDTCGSLSQIVPVIIGDNDKALAIAKALKEKHIIAVAIRPPTVPMGTARIRFSVHNDLTDDELDHVATTFIKICKRILTRN